MATPINEDQLQVQCVEWYNETFPSLRRNLYHTPNGGFRTPREAAKFTAMGVRPGVADLTLILLRIYFIELKFENGRQSKDQMAFAQMVIGLHHRYYVAWDFEQFKSIIWQIIGNELTQGLLL